MAAPWIDWRLASEIEKFPRAVLQERLGYKTPDDHNQGDPLLWGDMTEVTPDLARSRGVPLPEIMIAGTPCQAFSIAGLRGGIDDARGNLTLKFVETCHAIVDARLDGKLAVLWENVPGVLSDKGNAFGCFLGGLVGADDALSAPDGGSWPSVGMVSGPRARCAWRVLDAQYFGLAQRRRRVFVVVDFGNVIDPAAVLFERKRLRGDTPPRRETGQGSAQSFECSPSGGYHGKHANAEMSPAIAFDPNQITSKTNRSQPKPEQMHTLPATAIAPVLFQPQVRRLMPIECERLQGFPDNHTLIQYRNKDAADGPRYKALGNSMAISCIAWMTDRMKTSMDALS